MGRYYSPAAEVIEGRVGRKLEQLGDTYDSYFRQLRPGEYLYLAAHNGNWWVVVFIDSPAEFTRTFSRPEGKTHLQFYALPETAHRPVPKPS